MQSDYRNTPAFETIRPRRQSAPLVFNSPHSGRDYPHRFLAMTRLDHRSIRQSEDAYVDEIFARAPHMGAPLLKANFPRAYLDANREPYELDPAMFSDRLPKECNVTSARVAAGLGTLARIVAEGKPIYREKLTLSDARMRIEGIYRPYHAQLQKLLTDTANQFGVAVLVDCHSMPSTAGHRDERPRPEFVLGDRYGTSCAAELTDLCAQILARRGYSVTRNKPYAGGFITEHYGQPARGLHAMQIEVNRSLYMDERTLETHDGFLQLSADLAHLVRELGTAFEAGFLSRPEAAE